MLPTSGMYGLQAASLLLRLFGPEEGGDTFLRNVGSHLDYTAPYHRILQWQLKILHFLRGPVNEVYLEDINL
jgi:hypothetical protein